MPDAYVPCRTTMPIGPSGSSFSVGRINDSTARPLHSAMVPQFNCHSSIGPYA